MSESPSHPPHTDDPQHIDIEAIMKEIRAAAARSAVDDYAAGTPNADPDATIGIDDEALIERVMQRVRTLPQRAPTPPRAPADDSAAHIPDPVARQLGFDREREHGALHRLLGKARRWLFRVTKVQAEFEKTYERINAELQELERRVGAEALKRQLHAEQAGLPQAADPLHVAPEVRAGVSRDVLNARAAEYLPFITEACRPAGAAGNVDLLDLGCGGGALLAAGQAHGLSCLGVDPADECVTECTVRGLPARRAGLREFLLHCPEAEYRCAALLHVLEHLPLPDLSGLLLELRRIIAPGGSLLVEVPNTNNPLWAARGPDIRSLVQMCRTAGFSGVFDHPLHPPAAADPLPLQDPSLPGAGPINAAIERLNTMLLGPRDVLIVAERGGAGESA